MSTVTRGTGTTATRVIGAVAIAAMGWVIVGGLFVSPPDVVQGESVRIMYVHVPSAWIAYLAFVTTAVASAISLFRRHRSLGFDRVAGASAAQVDECGDLDEPRPA